MSDADVINWSRKIPLKYRADVAVIGGGIAGVAAACAVAESGASVLLVERFAVTGGNATSGGVAAFCGDTTGQGRIFDQILADLEKWNALGPIRPGKDNRTFDHRILAHVLQELLLRRGVRLLLHTRFVDALMQDGRVDCCVLCGSSGPQALRARVYVDCTGEAQLVRAAPLPVQKGRPADGMQLPMSMMGFVREVPTPPQVPDGWCERLTREEDFPMTSFWPDGPGGRAVKIKVPRFDSADTEQLTAAEIAARRRFLQVLDYYQRVEGKSWRYAGCSPIIGIREGRRAVGDYVLTVDDLRAGRRFDDAVARGKFYLDAHDPRDDKRTYILPPEDRAVPPYQIPFRSLLVKDAENLLVAGRCLSADQLAMSSARVMTTCAMMGQAAGVAAAMAADARMPPRNLNYAEIRREVEFRGAVLDV